MHLPVLRHSAPQRVAEAATELTSFLEAAMAHMLSQGHAPPCCPRCHSADTRFKSKSRTVGCVPEFTGHGCGRHFNRLVGTPLARLVRKDALLAFVRLLSPQHPLAAAIHELKLDERVARQWVEKFRAWLLTRRADTRAWSDSGSSHLPYEKRARQFR